MTDDPSDVSPLVVGISGASGSGKSTFVRELIKMFPPDFVAVLSQDHYYKDLSNMTPAQRKEINFDHPDAIDFDLLIAHLESLKEGKAVLCPQYDFTQHTRTSQIHRLNPAPLIIVEGILVLAVESCRTLFDYSVFIDTPLDLCFIRRLQRDLKERARSLDSVIDQYLHSVRPMYLRFVAPGKHLADYIVIGMGDMTPAIKHVKKTIHLLFSRSL